MKERIKNIYNTGTVVGLTGKIHKLHSAIDSKEGEFLINIINNDPKITSTLEIGCAYGLSSLHICLAIKERDGVSHIIIDPFQKTQWDGAGIRNLEEAGIGFFHLIEAKSEFALPRLLEEKEGQLDFIFIDGWHTFDHTLLDCFYATRLLRVGGYLVLDDVTLPSVRRVVGFLKNYPCYEERDSVSRAVPRTWKRMLARALMSSTHRRNWLKVLQPGIYDRIFDDRVTRMVALKKTEEDHRNWDWHDDAF